MAQGLRKLVRLIAIRLPWFSTKQVASRFVRQANLARDMQKFELAAELYEEALHILSRDARVHVQCGHMFKEARQFDRAEQQYEKALELEPNDPDLAMQIGHFYKVAGRIDDAREQYRRALDLRPGWIDAEEEFVRTSGVLDGGRAGGEEPIVPELAPRRSPPVSVQPSAFRLLRFGHRRRRGDSRGMKELAGIEAIRGYRITHLPITEAQLLIDGALVRSAPVETVDLIGAQLNQRKYVFNIWHDFSGVARGPHEVRLRLMAGPVSDRTHSEHVFVEDPALLIDPEASDAFVPMPAGSDPGLDAAINAAPSVIRSARRTPLPTQIRTILVQRVDQLGDFVCSVPAIRRLRTLFPEAQVIGLLTSANSDIARSIGLFDAIIEADYRETPAERRRTITPAAQVRVAQALAAYDFDLAIDLGEGSESRPLLQLSKAKFFYGFKDREAPWLSAGFEMNARDNLNGLETLSPTRKILAMVEALAVLRAPSPLEAIASSANPPPERYAVPKDAPYAVIHTGARLAFSRWQGYPALIELLLRRTEMSIVLFADDHDEQLPYDPRVTVLKGLLPFEHFDSIVAGCAIYIGNDSGPKHLAALRGRRTVSLHMARLNWNEWGQEGDGAIVSRRVPCAGCAIQHYPEECGKAFACLTNITPEEVFNATLSLLVDHHPAV